MFVETAKEEGVSLDGHEGSLKEGLLEREKKVRVGRKQAGW